MEGTEFAERLAPIFARLNTLVAYLEGFEVKRKTFINPLSSLNDKFFKGGILFQCVFDSKRRDVFAAGGRYDSLVREFSPKALMTPSQTHAVGFNLSWDRLSSSMGEYLKGLTKVSFRHPDVETGAFWKTRRVSIFLRPVFLDSLAKASSAMYLSPASMPLSCGRWVSILFRTFGQMTSVQSWLLMRPHSKNFWPNIKTTIMAGLSLQSRTARSEGSKSGA